MMHAASHKYRGGGRQAGGLRPAFTLVELIVAIAVIGVLATLIIAVGSSVVTGQKVRATQNTMRLVHLALDQFATEDPLSQVYNNARLRDPDTLQVIGRTFGPYPPYQLAGDTASVGEAQQVRAALEPEEALWPPLEAVWPGYSLPNRLWRDLGDNSPPIGDWVSKDLVSPPTRDRSDDDVRALHAYLACFTPGAIEQIPESALKPINPAYPEYVNPTGGGTDSDTPGLIDVFGIYDAWGVPLDYFLQVKLEYKVLPDEVEARWVVTDRVPVLRSHGVAADAVGSAVDTSQRWIFSQPFPQPAANADPEDGGLTGTGPADNGWARAVALDDDYQYVPQ